MEEGLRLMRGNGDRALEVSPRCGLATLALWQGDAAQALVQARAALDTAVAVHARDQEAAAWCRVGEAELALGRHAAAAQAFDTAQGRAVDIASPHRHDAAAGLARVALARGDVEGAMQALEPLLALGWKTVGDGDPLEGAEFPHLIEWTCHRVLVGARDPRADEWLTRAHEALHGQASTIADGALRDGFLRNIPVHREISAAWSARNERR
jgi:tetratricopeptide (TPR) repeat protein